MKRFGKRTVFLVIALALLAAGSSMLLLRYWDDSDTTEQNIVKELRDFELPVHPKASGAKEYFLKGGYIHGVSYKGNARYPAEEVLEFFEEELRELGFERYSEEYYDYAGKTWTYFTDSTHERKPFVAQSLMSWADSTRTRRANVILKYFWYGAAKSFSRLTLSDNNDLHIEVQILPFYTLPSPREIKEK